MGSKQTTARATGREDLYFIGQLDGSTGLLAPVTSALVSDTAGRYTTMDARGLGARLAQIAGLYNQWRIKRLTFKYRPFNYQGEYISNDLTTVPGSYPLGTDLSHLSSRIAAGFVLDPTVGPLSFSEVIECGGREFNPARPASWTLKKSRWLFVDPRTGDTTSDLRFISPGQFNCVSYANGPTSSQRIYGACTLEWDIQFRFPVDADANDALRIDPFTMFKEARKTLTVPRTFSRDESKSTLSQSPVTIDFERPFFEEDEKHFKIPKVPPKVFKSINLARKPVKENPQ